MVSAGRMGCIWRFMICLGSKSTPGPAFGEATPASGGHYFVIGITPPPVSLRLTTPASWGHLPKPSHPATLQRGTFNHRSRNFRQRGTFNHRLRNCRQAGALFGIPVHKPHINILIAIVYNLLKCIHITQSFRSAIVIRIYNFWFECQHCA
jgi:hypothetical protein